MQWNTIADQWLWFAAAGLLVVLMAALAAPNFYKPKSNPDDPIQDQQDGWTPTGRIDFTNSAGNFILQVEETRSEESLVAWSIEQSVGDEARLMRQKGWSWSIMPTEISP